MSKNPVVHFEMPAKDKTRAKKFYEQAFGWKMEQLGADFGNYLMATTAETDEKNMVKIPGTINGGFFDYKDDELNRIGHVVVSVDNIDEAMAAVKIAGGEIKTDKMDIPGVGLYVSFADTEGNIVGMLQPARV